MWLDQYLDTYVEGGRLFTSAVRYEPHAIVCREPEPDLSKYKLDISQAVRYRSCVVSMWQRDLPAEVPSVDADMAVCHEGRSETSVQEAHPQLSPCLCGLSELSGPGTNEAYKGAKGVR